jgi:Uncharacterised nucleotidyltransferase
MGKCAMESAQSLGTGVPVYEELLDCDGRWALSEGSRYFEERSAVQDALLKITRRLEELEIPYAVSGGMALFKHGHRRFTEDVDILVSRDGLNEIHARLDGLGYVRLFSGSKGLRETANGVRIEFLIAGEYPGDGKPKSVAFPQPEQASIIIDGIRVLSLTKLVELKLASGMTGGIHRLKDFVDVVALIEKRRLPAEFVEELNPYVREKYLELWRGVQEAPPGPDEG